MGETSMPVQRFASPWFGDAKRPVARDFRGLDHVGDIGAFDHELHGQRLVNLRRRVLRAALAFRGCVPNVNR